MATVNSVPVLERIASLTILNAANGSAVEGLSQVAVLVRAV